MLLLQFPEAPRDLTVPNARARTYLYSVPLDAKASGFPDLRKRLLPVGDVEVRYWGGFAWGTRGLVFQRRAGVWSATKVMTRGGEKARRLPAPKSGWPAFWRRAEGLGIWTLPDEAEIKDRKGYAKIFDGYSTLVETQRKGMYRAYGYDNPTHQTDWRYAKPMAALDRLIRAEFPGWQART